MSKHKLIELPTHKPHQVVVLAAEMRRHGWAIWCDGKREMSGVTEQARAREVVVQAAQNLADKKRRCLVPVLEMPDPWLPARPHFEMSARVGRWLEQLSIAAIPGWVTIELSEWRELLFGRKRTSRMTGRKIHQHAIDVCEAMKIKLTDSQDDAEAHMLALWGSQANKVADLLPPSKLFRRDYEGRVWMPRVIDGGQTA